MQHANQCQETWEALFTNMMGKMLEEEERVHGPDEELQKVKDGLFGKVIPRLLRPMETAGGSISHPLPDSNRPLAQKYITKKIY